MDADVVIEGGTVVDGSRSPARRADVAIHAGRVVAVGEGLTGAEVIDAAGRVVTPGFFDIHTHYDAQVFWDPALTSSCWHGVTSVVAGNCGFRRPRSNRRSTGTRSSWRRRRPIPSSWGATGHPSRASAAAPSSTCCATPPSTPPRDPLPGDPQQR